MVQKPRRDERTKLGFFLDKKGMVKVVSQGAPVLIVLVSWGDQAPLLTSAI